MRQALILILMSMVGGCAATHRQEAARPVGRPQYQDAPAVALAFTPAVAAMEPPIALWRDERAPGAFVGFEDLGTSFIYSFTDDHQADGGAGYYVRRTIVEKTGVSYR